MWLIILLIIIGALLLVAEIILLPGVSIAGIGGFIAYGVAIYLGFIKYDSPGGFLVIGAVVVVSLIAIAISVRARTWQRLSLKHQIDSTSQPLPESEISVGDRGITITRLAPSGKISVNDDTYEARSLGDVYVDQQRQIEVVGFENFSVIVKTLDEP